MANYYGLIERQIVRLYNKELINQGRSVVCGINCSKMRQNKLRWFSHVMRKGHLRDAESGCKLM